MKYILSSLLLCFSGVACAQTVDQYEVRKRTSSGFTSYGVTLTNGQVIGQTAGIPAAITISGGAWGSITGTLSAQTDLQTALDAKLASATAASTYQPLTSILTAFSGLGNASGVPTNNGSGTLSYTATSSGGAGPGDANKIVKFNGSGALGSISGVNLTALNASEITSGSMSLTRIAQGSASSGQVVAWNGSAWAPATISSGLTIGSTAISGGTSGRLLTSGSTLGELALGTGVSTWLGTPTVANLNTVLGSTLATTGANTFTASQTITSSGVKVFDINVSNGGASVYTYNGVNWAVYDSVSGYRRSYEQGGVWFGTTGFAMINNSSALRDDYSGLRLCSTNWVGWSADSTFYGTNDLIVRRKAAATLQLGTDAATPTTQAISAHNGTGTDKAGADLQILGGQSTGTGTPGNVIFRTATAGSTGSSTNGYTTRMTISPSGTQIGVSGSAIKHIKRVSVTLVSGTATVSDTDITANTAVIMPVLTPGGVVGTLDYDVSAGSSFTINSSSAADTSTIICTVIIYP